MTLTVLHLMSFLGLKLQATTHTLHALRFINIHKFNFVSKIKTK